MKAISLFMLLFAFTATQAQNNQQAVNGANIVIIPDTVNLGEIYLDELSSKHGKVQIKVGNTGNRPLILHKVSGCCGTNIKNFPKAPILPGKEAIIDVEFRPEYTPQTINRTVTIESNSASRQTVKVPIIGIVVERKSANEIEL